MNIMSYIKWKGCWSWTNVEQFKNYKQRLGRRTWLL